MTTLPHPTLGRNGLISAEDKREGDGCTPIGTYPLREVWYRADRLSAPRTALPLRVITPADCWCDDPTHPQYNQHCVQSTLPASASCERLWREDGAYDVLVVIGYNDAPALPHKGSAIFIHCEHDDGRATAGCIALPKQALLEVVETLTPASTITLGEKTIVA